MDTRLLLTIEEAADALSISRAHMFKMLRDGDLPTITFGKSRRIPLEGLKRYIEERTVYVGYGRQAGRVPAVTARS